MGTLLTNKINTVPILQINLATTKRVVKYHSS